MRTCSDVFAAVGLERQEKEAKAVTTGSVRITLITATGVTLGAPETRLVVSGAAALVQTKVSNIKQAPGAAAVAPAVPAAR